MNITYAQKQAPTQKKDAPTASSVLDSSSQSEGLQRKADMANNAAQRAEAPRPNNTGMPDNLKASIESLSGFSMDDVRVHYNSSKPATVQALAYTQGTDIHVAPGQEKHLPHEAWHVAQQMAGRVSPTTNINGMPVNDNAALEHEADMMGEKAVQCKKMGKVANHVLNFSSQTNFIQRFKIDEMDFVKVRQMAQYLIQNNYTECPNGWNKSFFNSREKLKKDDTNVENLTTWVDVLKAIATNDSIKSDMPILSVFNYKKMELGKMRSTPVEHIFYSNVHPGKNSILCGGPDQAKAMAKKDITSKLKKDLTPLKPPMFLEDANESLEIYQSKDRTTFCGLGAALHGPQDTYLIYEETCRYPMHYHAICQPLTRNTSGTFDINGDYSEPDKNHYLVDPFGIMGANDSAIAMVPPQKKK